MLTVLALSLAAGRSVPAGERPSVLTGECTYPPVIAEQLPAATQVLCDTVEVSDGGVDFQRRGWDVHSRFFGTWRGDVLTVTAIQPAHSHWAEANGQCRIDHAQGRISFVSCTAFGSGRGWVANFRNVRP